jgi:hypothetical protein
MLIKICGTLVMFIELLMGHPFQAITALNRNRSDNTQINEEVVRDSFQKRSLRFIKNRGR